MIRLLMDELVVSGGPCFCKEETKLNHDGHRIFQMFIELAPYLQEIFVEDISISIQDTERIIRYLPGKTIDLGIREGDLLKEGSVSYQVIQTGRKVMRAVGREVHGIPYIAVGYPIFHEDALIGCITTIMSIDKRDRMLQMAEQLSAAMQQFTANIQAAISRSELLYQHNELMKQQARVVMESIEYIDGIIRTIEGITGRTNILGLNASIEAARAGQVGRGFSVVASEIRSLADTARKSTKEIASQLSLIQSSVANLIEANQGVFALSKELSSHLMELTGLIEELTGMAMTLSDMAKLDT